MRPVRELKIFEVKKSASVANGSVASNCHCSYPTSPIKEVSHAGGFPKAILSPTSPPNTDSKRVASDGMASAITSVVPAKYGPDKRAAAIPNNKPARSAAITANAIASQTDKPRFRIPSAAAKPPTAMSAP
ncbi:unannotated protein [freshwater metagenome]|uniref:Unannotated protein n=1 Tax=freshwater metagenome TaxID=449393 RepID=A0A6J7AAB2_9ZZZZ